jgi:UPF0042 nucleotide-binding protein
MTDFVVIAGLSGAGRSTVADTLEDRGWFVIDNLPIPLIPKVTELVMVPESSIDRVALALGPGVDPGAILPAIAELRGATSRTRVIFLEASTEALVRRYESTKRRHPQASGDRLAEAIERERELLDPVKAEADVIVDTTDLNVHQLRSRVNELFADDPTESTMQISVLSFGYKHGLPTDVDMVLDCRFLPNPYWVDSLRPLTGLDLDVVRHVLRQDSANRFLEQVESLLEMLVPEYESEGKAYLSIAFGCTGGRHRSVVIAQDIASRLRARGLRPTVKHRDIER